MTDGVAKGGLSLDLKTARWDDVIRQIIQEHRQQREHALRNREVPSTNTSGATVQALFDAGPDIQAAAVSALVHELGRDREPADEPLGYYQEKELRSVTERLLRRKLSFTETQAAALARAILAGGQRIPALEKLVGVLEKMIHPGMSAELRVPVEELAKRFSSEPHPKYSPLGARLAASLSSGITLPLTTGEAWADAALAELSKLSSKHLAVWDRVLRHCLDAKAAMPPASWLVQAAALREEAGRMELRRHLLRWFPLVDHPSKPSVPEDHPSYRHPSLAMGEPHASLLKGLVWFASLDTDVEIARALGALALSSSRKLPGSGPRLLKVANACFHSLSLIPGEDGVHQLAILKARLRTPILQAAIVKALDSAAERSGLSLEELEEMTVPDYGLTAVGAGMVTLGEFTAHLRVSSSQQVELNWSNTDGQSQRAIPPEVKATHAADLKELQATIKDIQAMLPAQRARLENLLLEARPWPLSLWRNRYLDHPLVGVLARRLLWNFTTAGKTITGIWVDGQLVNQDGQPIENSLSPDSAVALWHPIGRSTAEVVAWRQWLESQRVQQPFKQAHREIYLLTDAERQTGTHSNRFAAHILQQDQFRALAQGRYWQPPQLGPWDGGDRGIAHRPLPDRWRAELALYAAGPGDYLHYPVTNQVRFYHGADRQPQPLESVPALIFSEVMRDLDLFAGIAGIGNDPAWQDAGPEGLFRNYWQQYSFGELSVSAEMRRDLLASLLPKLKITASCSLADRFLVVKGKLRTYKIHLGSGNILMSPNDQYLCIVPAANQEAKPNNDGVFLPFEGDRTLAIILSKAFLLAEDHKIKDSSITRQIQTG